MTRLLPSTSRAFSRALKNKRSGKISLSLLLFLIISAGILLYSNSLGNDFIWDDSAFVVENGFIKALRPVRLYFTSKDALAKGGLSGENYRPFLPLSYAIDYSFWKLNPFGYHLTNLIFHILNALLVFLLVFLLTQKRVTSFLAGLIFSVHPIQTESVAWISGRADVMFLSFYLAALISYIHYTGCREKHKRFLLYAASLFCFSCSLLSKEMAASLPFIIILYDILYSKREKISALAIRYFPFFLILEFFLFLRFNIIGKLAQCPFWTGDAYTTLLSMAKGIVYYIKLLFYPVNLCADYMAFPICRSIREPAAFFSVLAIALLIALSIKIACGLKIYLFVFFGFL